ncbi:uncharacterized protein E0L32_007158 [Thyridium curvatum]|uniref:Uncharacterized protein n=1 Tax=Thyridium curvatum TaxID=1093900 RepID=A0A507AWD8_9PEZI|nr:uncharacterized protein E0L32_007158 [Thyridium curvatum]TPX12043.1 hypothetical protein E0L32_007158 [Thyridium curvatum]
MSSSAGSTGLARTRSLRKPAAASSSADKEAPRNASPSRLPMAAGPGRTAAAAAPSTRQTRSGTVGTNIGATRLGRSASVKRAAPETSSSAVGGASSSRPRSMIQPSSSATTRSAAAASSSAIGGSSAAAAGPAPAPKRMPTHSRAKSSATALTSQTVLRPPSQTGATTTAAAAGTSSTRAGPSSGTGSRSMHRRQLSNVETSSTPPRTRSATTSAATAAVAVGTAEPRGQMLPPSQRLARPAFSTMQQHYSPAKSLAPKPLTSTFLAPPSPSKLPANVAVGAETARLQTELLQLHLLHRDAAPVDAQWRAGARHSLGRRFGDLAREAEAVGREEARALEGRNAAALCRAWGRDGGEAALGERVRVLGEVVSGVWALGEPGAGKYPRVVRRFERWMQKMAEVVRRRRWREGEQGPEGLFGDVVEGGDGDDGDGMPLFIGELDASWRDECAALARKLDGWRRLLRELGDNLPEDEDEDDADADADERSSLAQMVGGCRSLVHDMLAELHVMEEIEREALRQENEWIRRMNADEEEPRRDAHRAGAVWRVF